MYLILEGGHDASLKGFLETCYEPMAGDKFEETSKRSIAGQDGESPNFNDTDGTNERLRII